MYKYSCLILLLGCGEPLPVYWIDAREDRFSWQEREEMPFDRIQEACGFWNLVCFETDDEDGALMILLDDYCVTRPSDGEAFCGHYYYGMCDPGIWSSATDYNLEHEIGHFGGLEHRDDQDNLMFWYGTRGNETTNLQMNYVQNRADLLENCIGG